jgi:hypothetical protein
MHQQQINPQSLEKLKKELLLILVLLDLEKMILKVQENMKLSCVIEEKN